VTIVVVGASGAVGTLLIPHWQKSAVPVLLQYRGSDSPWAKSESLKWNCDTGVDALERWKQQHGPISSMIVLAGVTPRSGSDLSLNTTIAEKCLHAAHACRIPRVMIASSSAVYGDHLDRPFAEGDEPRPVNPYGIAKLEMERACERLSAPDITITRLRIGNVAGADALLSQIRQPQERGLSIDRFEDGGTPLRSYIGPGTLAEALARLARLPVPLPDVLNVGAPDPVEMGNLADSAGLRWLPVPKTGNRGQRITLNCERLWSLVPCQPNASDPNEMVHQLTLSWTRA